jgi:CDGSH-type Zn-finger protein
MDGTTEGCVASLKDACGEKNKRWRPFCDASYHCVEFHSDSAKRLVMMYSIMDM